MDFTGHVTSEQAAELLGINRQSLYNLVNRDPDFPKPTKLGRTSLWRTEDLRAWRKKHPAKPRSDSS